MKVKNNTLVIAIPALQKIQECTLPIRACYRIVRNINKINSELSDFNNSRLELFKKYGKETENKQLEVPEENRKAFLEELQVLLDEEVEVDIHPLEYDDIKDVNITTKDFTDIQFLITNLPE